MINLLIRVLRAIRRRFQINPSSIFPINPPLTFPEGMSEQHLFDFVISVRVEDAPEAEMKTYGTNDFKRFVYTWGLAKEINGKCLEDITPIISSIRMIKSEEELKIARHAGEVALAMMEGGKRALGHNVPEYEVAIATSQAGTRKAAELLKNIMIIKLCLLIYIFYK